MINYTCDGKYTLHDDFHLHVHKSEPKRRYMSEIWPISRKTLSNQSTNQQTFYLDEGNRNKKDLFCNL